MRADMEGSAVAPVAPVSRFAGTLLDILDRVTYSRVRMDVTDNPIYRLRYEAYRREESVPFNDQGIVVDDLDTAPNGMSFGVHIDGELVSSIRLHHLSAAQRWSPSMKVFPDVLEPMLQRGDRFIDPSRFTSDYEASLAYPALPFLTLRIAVMATVYFEASMCLALVRPEHTAFYRRVFQSEAMSEVRSYPGLAFPVTLYGARVEESRHRSIFSRYPFFMSTEDERSRLFSQSLTDAFDTPQRATSRLAYERSLLGAQQAVAAE